MRAPLAGVAAAVMAPAPASRLQQIAALLEAEPGRTSVEVRDALRSGGRAAITTGDVDRLLRSSPGRFGHDGGEPPRWRLSSGVFAVAAPARRSVVLQAAPLYRWQEEALAAWRGRSRRGVVEAVTGTGKTMVGVAAAVEELSHGGQVCVVVPTRELLIQWREVLRRTLPAGTSVGLLGGGHHSGLGDHDVLVTVVNSARWADLRPRRPGGLLVADECHRYGSEGNRLALGTSFAARLGLSATYARSDDAHLVWLDPYFGGTCFRMGYRRAIDDGVTARFAVALVGVRFTPDESLYYQELTQIMSASAAQLIVSGMVPSEPVGAFFQAVALLARGGDDDIGTAARRYLAALQARRQLLAETPAKTDVLGGLVPALQAADRTLVFTQSIAAAERAASQLRADGLQAATVHSGLDPQTRRSVLDRFAAGELRVVAAPQVLDEGIDVPAADVAVILAASRSRRQMVQRMGRILRRKADGRRARFVVVAVEGTIEDPASGAHEGFLDEVTDAADEVRRFPSSTSAAQVCAFVDQFRAP